MCGLIFCSSVEYITNILLLGPSPMRFHMMSGSKEFKRDLTFGIKVLIFTQAHQACLAESYFRRQ